MSWYILTTDNQPVAVSVREAAQWMDENPDRVHVGFDEMKDYNGHDVRVSTVFLGLDHSWNRTGLVLWETMIFGGDHDQNYQERYSSYEDAVEGHQNAIDFIQKKGKFKENGKTKN
jgi:hypothetical protein